MINRLKDGHPMEKSQYSPERIAFAPRQAENGAPVPEVCRKIRVSKQAYFRLRKQTFSPGVGEVRRLKIFAQENWKLRQLVANLSLDKQMLQDML
jgi:putative transposase